MLIRPHVRCGPALSITKKALIYHIDKGRSFLRYHLNSLAIHIASLRKPLIHQKITAPAY